MDLICETPGQDVNMLSMEGSKLSYPNIIHPEGKLLTFGLVVIYHREFLHKPQASLLYLQASEYVYVYLTF